MIYLDLQKQSRLATRRHPMFQEELVGRVMIYISLAFGMIYLLLLGFSLDPVLSKLYPNMESYYMLNKGILFFFIADFFVRLHFQKLPDQAIKPYLLLPIKRGKLVNFMLAKSAFSAFNYFYLFGIIPFACSSLTSHFGISGAIGYIVGFYLMTLTMHYGFMLFRRYFEQNAFYIVLPLLLFALLGFYFKPVGLFMMNFTEGFYQLKTLPFVFLMLLITTLFLLNRKVMGITLLQEMAKKEEVKKIKATNYTLFQRFGEVGIYMQLEIKLLFRNKRTKGLFQMGCFFIVLLTAMLFSEAYTGQIGQSFVVTYNCAVLGVVILSQLMCFEGNYLDGLMSKKESILSLLKAKYYFYCLLQIIPITLMIPAMVMGKISLLMVLSYSFLSTGFVYMLLFQLAVFNKKSVNLNDSLMGKRAAGSGFQNVIGGVAMGGPILIGIILRLYLSETAALWVVLLLGATLTFTSNLWIQHIYTRFMKRRYENMQGFRNSK